MKSIVIAALLCLGSFGAATAAYPERPVKIVVPFPPGGGTDIIARVLAQKFSLALGKQFVVENKPGAGAMIGADHVAKSAPDGYTVLLGTSGELTISPGLFKDVAYDPVEDFAPLALLGTTPVMLVAHPSFPSDTLADVIARAKAAPGTIAIGSGGQGAAPQLGAELLRILTGIDVIIVPYKGAGPAVADAVSGQIGATFTTVAAVIPYLQSQSVKPLAVIAEQRSMLLPNVPSATEQGVLDYEVLTWFGLFVPAKTPVAIQKILTDATRTALQDPEVTQRLISLGIEPGNVERGGDILRRRIRTEVARWKLVIRDANIKPD